MKAIYLNSIEEIKEAVDNGIIVYSDTAFYKVIKDKYNNYLIKANNGFVIGLHGQEGTEYENILNGNKFWFVN
jgi:hypothetical protein